MKKKTVKEVKRHKFLVCACKSQNFGQSQTNFAWSHDRETVTFRNSAGYTGYFRKITTTGYTGYFRKITTTGLKT